MPYVSLKQIQRGPTCKVVISLLFIGGDDDEKTTETIIIDNVVEVSFKFTKSTSVTPYVRMKSKKANEQNTIVQIQASTRNKPSIINKQLICPNEWVELEMIPIGYHSSETINGLNTYFYDMNVDITVCKHSYAATLPNIEKLHQDTEFTDFQLCAADGKVALHKAFLAANSDVFKAMMGGDGEWKETAEGCINIDGVTVKTLQHLKDYMYRGVLPDEGLESLLVLASQYLMDKLKADCIQKLVQLLKLENMDALIKLAIQHDMPELVKALICKTPDSIVTDLYKLEIKGEESTDVDTK